jgi:orotate phosphoribosyltransferase-like protein
MNRDLDSLPLRTSTKVGRVRAFFHQYRHLTIRAIADELNINECTAHQLVTQAFNTRKVCAKIVPKNLNDDQKARGKEVSAEMLERLKTEPDCHNRVITGDESWFF